MIPESSWNDGPPRSASDSRKPPDRDAILPEGRIAMYHEGEYRPRLVIEANVAQEIPAGSWYWIAEAPGYVSVVSGLLHLPAGAKPLRRSLVVPMAEACEIELRTADRWQGVHRVDAVSLDRQAVYPVVVSDRRSFPVPAGRFLAYTVSSRGIEAISPISRCLEGETHQLSRPQPPPPLLAGHQ